MEVDAEDERMDAEKTTKVCPFLEMKIVFVTLLRIAMYQIVNKDNKDMDNKEKDPTKDLRLCMKLGEGKHPKTGEVVKGWFCKFCL